MMFQRKRTTVISMLALFSLAAMCLLIIKFNNTGATTSQEAFHQKVRNGLAQLNVSNSSSFSAVSSQTENLANLIYNRSGVTITQSNKENLRDAEQLFRQQNKGVTPQQLTQIIADMAVERLQNSTDNEARDLVETLKGFDAPDLPERFRNTDNVKPRANGNGYMSATTFAGQLNNIRNISQQNDPQAVSNVRTSIYYYALRLVNQRVEMIASADVQNFGNLRNKIKPADALLITYSVVADDLIAGSQNELVEKMQNLQLAASQAVKSPYPKPQNYKAYGTNGYLYSSPVGLVLNESTVNRLLNLIKERAN